MKRTPVSSSNVVSVGYDAGALLLEVEFKSGTVYQYSGVPEWQYVALIHAGSVGSYLSDSIKPRYPYRRVR